MKNLNVQPMIFCTIVGSLPGKKKAQLMIESLRTFGGEYKHCPVWLFEKKPPTTHCEELEFLHIDCINVELPSRLNNYIFSEKVSVCAQAEELAKNSTDSLVWVDPCCLFIQPPTLFKLNTDIDAAVRPVHIRNVGSVASEPIDDYWKRIYSAVGVKDVTFQVKSFVDEQILRGYFNTHAFAINPTKGICKKWLQHFEELVLDQKFQKDACQSEQHRLFLFQAVLSALIASKINQERIHILPPQYNYPYNLQQEIPKNRRANSINDLELLVYEGRSINPLKMEDIEVDEPLRSWLIERTEVLNHQ